MAAIERGGGAGHLGAILGLGAVSERTDAELLDRFAARRDEGAELAFGVLVARHGPMVLRTCRAVLRDAHDAEDAFQATFLVLARRRPRAGSSLGPWLHEVAHRTALCARSAALRRRRHEGSAAQDPARPAADDRPCELAGLVDEEVRRLPERFRPVVVLCLLEGRTPEQAARLLGCPVGTVHSRLARGRQRLRGQLARRGVAAPSALFALKPVEVGGELLRRAAAVATRVAAGETAGIGAGPAQVAALAGRVAMMMTLAKLKWGAMVLAVGCGLGAAGLVAAGPNAGQPPADPRPALAPAPAIDPTPVATPTKSEPSEIEVRAGGSIQAAIDGAPDGATIRVAAGRFPETLVIRKPLTLEGAGWDRTTIGPEKVAPLTRKQKDEFLAQLDAAVDDQARARLAVAYGKPAQTPTLAILGAQGVVIRGVKVQGPPLGGGAGISDAALVVFDGARGVVDGCAVVGPYDNGVALRGGADLAIRRSLIAALWGTGVAAPPRSKLALVESDVRNCYHRGVTIATDDARVERCRISGSAWHGIRYDNCSPQILSNQIFGNARSGIYASGRTTATVRGNVFWRNEMDAMSCWFAVADAVEGNTVVGNLRDGILVLGGSKPSLARNVFVGNPVGVGCGKVAARNEKPEDAPTGAPTLTGNVFFDNPKAFQEGTDDKPLPPGNRIVDPKLGDAARDFRPAAGSPALRDRAGAADPAPLASPFALQPEEAAMVPDSDTRSSERWKKPAAGR